MSQYDGAPPPDYVSKRWRAIAKKRDPYVSVYGYDVTDEAREAAHCLAAGDYVERSMDDCEQTLRMWALANYLRTGDQVQYGLMLEAIRLLPPNEWEGMQWSGC